jgi:6,7-dimethyl-8-ribityllumazine synthase
MPTTIEGDYSPPQGRFAIVAARFNSTVVDRLVDGALEGLKRHGVADADVDVVRVPGSFEIPVIAQELALSGEYAAVICLGAIVKGETDHYDYICSAAASGVASAALNSSIPVIFGVLTCHTMEQAMDRAGGKAGNKGLEAALTAVEMANLLKKLG